MACVTLCVTLPGAAVARIWPANNNRRPDQLAWGRKRSWLAIAIHGQQDHAVRMPTTCFNRVAGHRHRLHMHRRSSCREAPTDSSTFSACALTEPARCGSVRHRPSLRQMKIAPQWSALACSMQPLPTREHTTLCPRYCNLGSRARRYRQNKAAGICKRKPPGRWVHGTQAATVPAQRGSSAICWLREKERNEVGEGELGGQEDTSR